MRFFLGLHRHQDFAIFLVVLRVLAVNGHPTWVHQHLAFGLEGLIGNTRNAGGCEKFRRWEKHRHETTHHQVINFLLGFTQAAGRLQGWNDREVVADFFVIENTRQLAHVAVLDRQFGMRCQVRHPTVSQHFEGILDGGYVILWQGARIGTRVGQRLVTLIQALCNLQGGFGGVTKLTVGLTLQRRQVEQGWT